MEQRLEHNDCKTKGSLMCKCGSCSDIPQIGLPHTPWCAVLCKHPKWCHGCPVGVACQAYCNVGTGLADEYKHPKEIERLLEFHSAVESETAKQRGKR